jgi:hypothetical protein
MDTLKSINEIYIDGTYKTSTENAHRYSIVGEEDGFGIPLWFMLMEIGRNEDMLAARNVRQAQQFIKAFSTQAKELELNPKFVHTDKDWAEITPVQVYCQLVLLYLTVGSRSMASSLCQLVHLACPQSRQRALCKAQESSACISRLSRPHRLRCRPPCAFHHRNRLDPGA